MTANYHNHNRQWRRFPALCWPGSVAILSFLLLPMGAAAAPPTVSNIGFEAGSHSSVAITFAVSAAINVSRIRYIPVAQGSCTSGTGGQVQNNSMGSGTNILSYIRLDVTGLLPNTQYQFCPEVSSDGGGTWSSGAGATWTTLPLPAIHPALPIHPATFDTSYPDETQGTCWSTGQPGYCKVTETVAGNSCPNLSSDIATAVQHQMAGGTEIDIPAGSVCTGRIWWEQMAPDSIAYDPSKVSNNTITLANHGLAEGQGVVFDNTLQGGDIYNAAMPGGLQVGYVYFVHVVDANNFQLYYPWTQTTGSTVSGSTTITVAGTTGPGGSTGIATGQEIVGTGIPANTTVTAISGNSLTLSQAATATASGVTLTFGGGLVSITPGGTPGNSNYDNYFVKWPRPVPYWVIVRTSTPDSQFAPAGTRVNPAWAPKMAVLQMPAQTTYQPNVTDVLFAPLYGYDSYGSTFATKIRFTGIEFTWASYTGPASDPVGHSALVFTQLSDSNLVFDRDWFHNPSTRQDRVIQAFNMQGMNMAIKDSYWDGMDYWRPTYVPNAGLDGSNNEIAPAPTQINSTSFSIAPVKVYYGAANPGVIASTMTVSWSGTPSNTISNPQIAVYFDMNGNLITAVPTGITATASQGSIITVSTGTNGNLSCSSGTAWPGQDPILPLDANGRAASAPLGCANLNSSGQISQLSVNNGNGYDAFVPSEITEGCQCMIAGVGPGPYQISDNYISGTGLVMHFDDAGGGRVRGDYLIRRNTWHTPFEHMATENNADAQAAGIPSDGYEYSHRQPLEWKAGQRAWIDGNIFDGSYKDVNAGNFVDLTPRTDGSTTDVDTTNNTFQHGAVGASPTTVIDGCCGSYLSWPAARWRLYNNLFWDINGWVYSTSSGGGFGAIFPGTGGPSEDVIVDHNTFYDFQGSNPQWMNWSGYPLEGFQMTNNIVPFANGAGFYTPGWSNSVNCTYTGNEAFMNCAFSAGSSPDYIFKNNAIVPSWSANGYPPSGQMAQATVEADFPDYTSQNYFLPSISGVPAAYASIEFLDSNFTAGNFSSHPDFRLQSTSAYQSGGADHASDGKAEGVDIDALEAAQGKVTLIGVPASSITTTSATVSFVAPDAQACPVDYSSTDPMLVTSFTRASDAGGGRVRNISLIGLTGKTSYYYRVNCAVQQPTGSFRTK